MKKLLTVMMVAIMSFTLLTGCGNEKKETVCSQSPGDRLISINESISKKG